MPHVTLVITAETFLCFTLFLFFDSFVYVFEPQITWKSWTFAFEALDKTLVVRVTSVLHYSDLLRNDRPAPAPTYATMFVACVCAAQ